MNSNEKRPVEDELRSSQLYKTLTGSGSPVADKIAQGLGKAAIGLDTALNEIAPAVKSGVGTVRQAARPVQPVQGQAAGQQPPRQQAAQTTQTAQPPNGYAYQYQYTSQPGNAGSQQARNVRPGKKPVGVSPAPAPQMPQMKLVHKGSPMKYYLTAVAALLYAMNAPLYEPAHYIIFAVTLVLVFFASRALFKGKKEWVPAEPVKAKEKPKAEPPKEEPRKSTGDPEVDKIIDEGSGYLKKLRAANDAIPDQVLTDDITRMEKASADIFRFIQDHPEKASQIRKFMNYYLPTTLKLLNSYQRLSAQSVKGENITSTLFNIAGMMHTVADAFEKQLDSLFTDEAMDISADISVFETLLKQEGFVEEKKKN